MRRPFEQLLRSEVLSFAFLFSLLVCLLRLLQPPVYTRSKFVFDHHFRLVVVVFLATLSSGVVQTHELLLFALLVNALRALLAQAL